MGQSVHAYHYIIHDLVKYIYIYIYISKYNLILQFPATVVMIEDSFMVNFISNEEGKDGRRWNTTSKISFSENSR